MGDTKFILFELHADGDLQIGPKTVPSPGSGRLSTMLGDEAEADEPESGGSGRALPVGPVGMVVALVVLVSVAFALKRLLGSGDLEVDEEFGVDVGD